MRKVPRQRRSRETVERIVAAGRDVLVDDGYDALTTNRVASVAGVSPGSLYQYFPDKGAIIDVVLERWAAELSDRVAATLNDRVERPPSESLHEVMDALVGALDQDAPLLRVVLEELPATRNSQRRIALEERVTELATAYLAGATSLLRAGSPASSLAPATVAWVAVIAVENLAVRWVLDRPSTITREQIVEHMTRLVDAYLTAVLVEDRPLTR